MVKKIEKGQRAPSNATAAADPSGLDRSDGSGCGCSRRQGRSGSKRMRSKACRGMKQAMAQVSENNSLGDSAGLKELEGLVQQVEMLKNKMRDLFIRAQEIKPRD